MASGYDTMMNPPIEELLEAAGSKFSLVTLSAMRSREITNYVGQLGQGIGSSVPPQVTSTASKPLSIAFEEISADKIEAIEIDPEEEAAAALALAEAEAAAELGSGPDESA
jgi:DNA-directed RNA polymerase subunit omega